MGKKKPILLTAAALAASAGNLYAQTANDVTKIKITDASFEDSNKAGKWSGDFSAAPNSSFEKIVGSVYFESWKNAADGFLGNVSEKQTIKLDKGYYELLANGSLQDQKNGKDGVKGYFLYAGDAEVEFGEAGTYCVPFSMSAEGNIEIGVKTNDAQGNWARVDNFQLISYDMTIEEYKEKQTLDLSIAVNKAKSYKDDPTLQALALSASEIQVKINGLENFSQTADTRAEIEAAITKLAQDVTNAAANYDAYKNAQTKYGNEWDGKNWVPVVPATGLLSKKAELETAWKNAPDAVKATEDAQTLYNKNITLIQAYINDAADLYKIQKADGYDKDGTIYDNTVASVDEAIEAITDGTTNAISHAQVGTAATEALNTYDKNAAALYQALVDPNYNADGNLYTDYYTDGLTKLNEVLRVINKVKADNDALYKEGKCDETSKTNFENQLNEATNTLAGTVKTYTDNADTWRLNYKNAKTEIATLTDTYKINITGEKTNAAGKTVGLAKESNSKKDKDGFQTKVDELKAAFSSAEAEIVAAIKDIQDNVDAANKAHTIAATEYYEGYGEAKKAVEDQVKNDGTLTKKVLTALSQYNNLKNAWNNYLYIAWTMTENDRAKYAYNVGLENAEAVVAAAKSADGKYTQAGRFEYLETPIYNKLAKLEADRVTAYNEAKAAGFLGTQGSTLMTSVQTAVGNTKSVTTGTIFADIKAYADQAAKTLGQYNAISDALISYDHALNGYDEFYTEAEIKAAQKGDDAYGKKTTDVKEHHAGLIETADKNPDVTTDGTLTGTTYKAAIEEIQGKITTLQGQVDAAIAATSKGKAHVDAVAALKTIAGYPEAIQNLTDKYSENESKWNQANLDAAKKSLLEEGQRRIDELNSEYAVKNQYADAESTTPVEGLTTDEYQAATYGLAANNKYTSGGEGGTKSCGAYAFGDTQPTGTEKDVAVAFGITRWYSSDRSGQKDSKIGDFNCSYRWYGNAGTSYTAGSGSVPTNGSYIKLTPDKTGSLKVYSYIFGSTPIYVIEDATEIEFSLNGTAVKPGATVTGEATTGYPGYLTFPVTAGKTYTVLQGAKMGFYGYELVVPAGTEKESLNAQLTAVKKTQTDLQNALDEAEKKEAAEAIPVLSQIHNEITTATASFKTLQEDAKTIAANYLLEKKANQTLKAKVQDDLTDYVAGNDTKKITSLLGLLPEINVNTKNPIAKEKGKVETEIGKYEAENAGVLGTVKDNFDAETLVANKTTIETTITTIKTEITNLRTLAQNEYDNTDKSATWDENVTDYGYEGKKADVLKGIEDATGKTGDGYEYFLAEYNKIATASTGTYAKLIAAAKAAKVAVAKAYEKDGKTLLPGTLDDAIYTDQTKNMTAKYASLKEQLDDIMTVFNGLVENATNNETAHTDQVAALTEAKALRTEVFNTINNAETSSYTETAIKEILEIDKLIKTYTEDIKSNWGAGTCYTNASTLEGQMTVINTRLKTLKDGWNDAYKQSVAKDNATRNTTFNNYYSETLVTTYTAQVNIFTKMSKLSYASGLTEEYSKATDGEHGVYNMLTAIRSLKKTANADYQATEAPALWDVKEENLAEAKKLTEEIISRVKTYCDAVNAQAKTTWSDALGKAEAGNTGAEGQLFDANAAIVSTLGVTSEKAEEYTKDVKAIIDGAKAKATTDGEGNFKNTDFAYTLDNEILPAFKTIPSKLFADKNAAAIAEFNAKMAAIDTTAEKTAIAGFYGTDGTLGAFSAQYQSDVIDKLEATKAFWAKVEKDAEFENYLDALAAGYNDVKKSERNLGTADEPKYETHYNVYWSAYDADKKFHANDTYYEKSKDLIASWKSVLDGSSEFVNTLFVKYNEDLTSTLTSYYDCIRMFQQSAETNHTQKKSEVYYNYLVEVVGDYEKIVYEKVKTTAIEKEQVALNGEIPSLRHDYEQAGAAVIGDETKAAEFEAKGYQNIIEKYVSKIERIYKDFNEGKVDEDGLPIYDGDNNRVKATAEETRLAYIALEKKMALTKDELTKYYDASQASSVATALQGGIDELTSYYQEVTAELENAHKPVVDKYQADADALKAAIEAAQTELNGYIAISGQLFYQNVMETTIANVKTEYAELKKNIQDMEKPYDQFDTDKAAITAIHTSLDTKLAEVYTRVKSYEHQITGEMGTWHIGVKGEEGYQEFDNYADYSNAVLAQSIQIQKDKLAAEVAPATIDVETYELNAESIEKKYNNYQEYPTTSIENMDGYFAYNDNSGYHTDAWVVVNKIESDLVNYGHRTAKVVEINAKKAIITTSLDKVGYYNWSLAVYGYSPIDIDGNPYTAETPDVVNIGTEEEPNYVLYEDLVKVSPTIVERLKSLIADADDLLADAEGSHVKRGDINNSNTVDIDDYTNLAQHLIDDNISDYTADEAWAADANADGEINVSDLQKIVNIISEEYKASKAKSAAAPVEYAANEEVTAEVSNGVLALGITNAMAYTGFQMDITLPSGASIAESALTERANGQEIVVNNIGNNTYRLLVMSNEAGAFNGASGAIANLSLENLHGTVAVSNIVFTDANAIAHKFTLDNSATTINGVKAQQSTIEKIYSVGGQVRSTLGKGVNIIKSNGVVRKIMNK